MHRTADFGRWDGSLTPPKPPTLAASPSLPSSADEASLCQAFSRGERAAVETLFRMHAQPVAGFVTRLGVERGDVEDVVQTTFAEAIRMASSFRGESSLRTWLFSIALNQSRAYIRGRARVRRRAEKLMHEENAVDVFDRAASPEGEVSTAQNAAQLREALRKLPDLQREALVLCELEELPAKVVSEMTGALPTTIWRRVHDAKVSLRKLLLGDDPKKRRGEGSGGVE